MSRTLRCLSVAMVLLLLIADASRSSKGEYQEEGAILSITRADIEFVLGESPREHDGEFFCTICGIFACGNAFWLEEPHKRALREFDASGRPLRTVPYPEHTALFPALLELLVMPDGIYALKAFRPNWPGRRLAYQYYDFSAGCWFAPVPVVDPFWYHDDLFLAAADGSVWVLAHAWPHRPKEVPLGLGIRLSSHGVPLDSVTIASEEPDSTLARCVAVNPAGMRMSYDEVAIGEYLRFVVTSGDRVLGSLTRRWGERRTNCERNDEIPYHPEWAVLTDGSLLELRTCVQGRPDDRVEVVRWRP